MPQGTYFVSTEQLLLCTDHTFRNIRIPLKFSFMEFFSLGRLTVKKASGELNNYGLIRLKKECNLKTHQLIGPS